MDDSNSRDIKRLSGNSNVFLKELLSLFDTINYLAKTTLIKRLICLSFAGWMKACIRITLPNRISIPLSFV